MKKFKISAAAILGGALAINLSITPPAIHAQEPSPPGGGMPGMAGMPGMNMGASSGATNDLFVMAGSDIDRPGLLPRANYSIGIGHMFAFLKKDPFGDELTFRYTYEDAGSGFWHSQFGSHTESFGIMKKFGLPKTKRVTGYTWVQGGISTFTGNTRVQNHFYDGESLG